MRLLLLLSLISFNTYAQHPAQLVARLKSAPDSEKVKIYEAISQAYARDQPDSAVHYAHYGMQLAEKQHDLPGQAALLVTLGYINNLHHHKELSRSFYNEALGIYRRLHNAAGIAHTYDELGLLDGDQQNFSKALKYYGDSRDTNGLIEAYEDMGKSFEENGDTEKALTYYLRALTQYEHRKQQPEAYFVLLENIGRLYLEKGDSTTALRYLEEGIRNSQAQGSRDTETHLLNAEGQVFEQRNETAKALTLYQQALAGAKQYQQPNEQAEALMHIAGILKKQNAGASIRNLKQALQIAKTLREPKLEARIYEALAGVYRLQNNYNEAMAALEEEHRLIDSLLNADTVKDIAALDSSYMLVRSREKVGHLQEVNRVEKTELLLALVLAAVVILILILLWLHLRKVNRLYREMQLLNEELKNSNRVKDTLFSVIGHDLKGPADSAAQLFELLEAGEVSEAEMRGLIVELRKHTSASLELLKALFEWGKAQLQGIKVNPVNFNANPVIDRCIQLLSQQAAQKNIHINNQLPDDLAIHADADHFEFVIRNLLSNAIKFSYKGGAIDLAAQLPAGQQEVVFLVRDNGVGISQSQQAIFQTSNLKVSFGTKQEKGSGLGLLLAKDFIKANHGRIWLESNEGKGATFYVALPLV